mmetsp:Transcript_22539/g.64063  ORF Transcript_22539/g.64063 Transcript_22539/m.64063 type:complete len:541 (+) Transcript_22539:1299-2921(+)
MPQVCERAREAQQRQLRLAPAARIVGALAPEASRRAAHRAAHHGAPRPRLAGHGGPRREDTLLDRGGRDRPAEQAGRVGEEGDVRVAAAAQVGGDDALQGEGAEPGARGCGRLVLRAARAGGAVQPRRSGHLESGEDGLVVRGGDARHGGEAGLRYGRGASSRHGSPEDAVAVRGDALLLVVRAALAQHLEGRREGVLPLGEASEHVARSLRVAKLVGLPQRLPILLLHQVSHGGVVGLVLLERLGRQAGRLLAKLEVDPVVEVSEPEAVVELRRDVEPPPRGAPLLADGAGRLGEDLLAHLVPLAVLVVVRREVARDEGERGGAEVEGDGQSALVADHASQAGGRDGGADGVGRSAERGAHEDGEVHLAQRRVLEHHPLPPSSSSSRQPREDHLLPHAVRAAAADRLHRRVRRVRRRVPRRPSRERRLLRRLILAVALAPVERDVGSGRARAFRLVLGRELVLLRAHRQHIQPVAALGEPERELRRVRRSVANVPSEDAEADRRFRLVVEIGGLVPSKEAARAARRGETGERPGEDRAQ